ncbi:hypothetical protein C4577_04995 [Candidatus Parcubacteria bacterium]|nr:MAG: hypothetical protein C4577_04995 [Candidatus Parcubacteria bacterium]
MKYTKEKPTQDGHYWLKEKNKNSYDENVVLVKLNYFGKDVFFMAGWEHEEEIDDLVDAEWSDTPIPKPE